MKLIYTALVVLCFQTVFSQETRTNPNLTQQTPSTYNQTPTSTTDSNVSEEDKQKMIDMMNQGVQNNKQRKNNEYSQSNFSSSKWRIGGNLGASFGNYTSIVVAPRIGYQISENIVVGGSLGYTYSKQRDYSKSNLFNFGAFVQPFFGSLFGIVDYEYYTGKQEFTNKTISTNNKNISESALWLGAGYVARMGAFSTTVGIQYNVLYKENSSVFGTAWQPVVGFTFGF